MSSRRNLSGPAHRRRLYSYTCVNLQVNALRTVSYSRLRTPVRRYYHRSLNVPKLVSVGFTSVPTNMTLARMMRQHLLPSHPHLLSQGLREMEDRDTEAVHDLYSRYSERFDMVPNMSIEEFRHQFMSGRGVGEVNAENKRRERQVVWTYVVEVCTFTFNV